LKTSLKSVAAMMFALVGAQAHGQNLAFTRCAKPLGMIAVVDGDAQGWTQYQLRSPRPVIAAMVGASGCFTLQNAASLSPPQYVLQVTASTANNVEAVETAMRIIHPGSGKVLVTGKGQPDRVVRLAKLDLQAVLLPASEARYLSTYGFPFINGFIRAYNQLVAKAMVPGALDAPAVPTAADRTSFVAAVDATMYAAPAAAAPVLATIGAGTGLKATGRREGGFVELTDAFGTTGWVSLDALR
jgi:hypothetical protein